MAFTFDDLPAHGDLPPGETRLSVAESVLKTLKIEGMPPIYGFINGVKLESDPSSMVVLQAWRSAGQPLGNHAYSHPSLNDKTAEQFDADIERNEPLLRQLMAGQDWHWFRYPFLWEGETLEKRNAVRAYLQQHQYRVAQVTMDFEDYLWNDPYARCMATHNQQAIQYLETSYLDTAKQYMTLFRGLSTTLYGREIPYVLLMHLGAFDARMLPQLIALYRQNGFSFISLADAEKDPAYATDPGLPLKSAGR